jgi:uncharacterized protein YgbK (DUF1537 family)
MGTEDPEVGVICTFAGAVPGGSSGTVTLAKQVVSELQSRRYDALVVVGGDGALAVLDELRAKGITITGRLTPGVPQGIVTGGLADGLPIVTRSGSFGGPGALVDTIDRLQSEPHRTAPPEQKESP